VTNAMTEENHLLREYAVSGSEDAFTTIVERYLPLVYAAAFRRVGGSSHSAEDVTQLVFTALARQAPKLTTHPDLTGWLFTTTRFFAANALRSERRRQSREQEAYMTQSHITDDTGHAASAHLQPMLDDVLVELSQIDRQIILLRFHRGLRLAEIGAQLNATDNAMQKRLNRALEQLREKLSRRGITSTVTALALALEHQSAVAIPAGLAATVAAAGLAGGTGAAGLLGLSNLMVISKLQVGLIAAAAVAVSAGLGWKYYDNARHQREAAAQSAISSARLAEMGTRLATQSTKAAAAEADVDILLTAVRANGTSQRRNSNQVIDARNLAKAAILRSQNLVDDGKISEGLAELMNCYRQLRAHQPGGPESQQIMLRIERLGRSFAPAKEALREFRDAARREFEANQITPVNSADSENYLRARGVTMEIAVLNERLGEGKQTVAIYDALQTNDPGRQTLAMIAKESFIEAQRYTDALTGTSFGSMLNEFDQARRSSGDKAGRIFLINKAAVNIEVLTGSGQLREAQILTEKLLAFDGSEPTRALINQRVARANQRPNQ
jgi:RNA polymerase sigma factor (sigma-70 family)